MQKCPCAVNVKYTKVYHRVAWIQCIEMSASDEGKCVNVWGHLTTDAYRNLGVVQVICLASKMFWSQTAMLALQVVTEEKRSFVVYLHVATFM